MRERGNTGTVAWVLPGVSEDRVIERLTGVYHAEGSLVGELRYLIGRTVGSTHCGLCDITHGTVREKRAWRACRGALGVPFETVHLDERSAAVRAVTDGATPAVVAHVGDDVIPLLGPDGLDACAGEPAALLDAVRDASHEAGLALP